MVLRSVVAAGLIGWSAAVFAASEPAYFTAPVLPATQPVSAASDSRQYRLDAARHVYAAYAQRILKGRLPPMIHAVVVVETTVDSQGRTRDVRVVRGPSHAPDVTTAVVQMIHRASPMPMPSRLGSEVRFTEVWLVHKDGRFQLDALTEGQD